MSELYRIDVHHHPSPPSYLSARSDRDRQYPQQRDWTVQKSLDNMGYGGVATAMLSLPHSAQIFSGGIQENRRLVREWNEFMATTVRDHPGRFGFFAALPILDIEGSLLEIEYSFDTLKADGITLMTNIGDRWLGDTHYDPIFEELNRRGAVLYVHPVAPNCCRDLLPEFNDPVIEYGIDTTRAIGKVLWGGAASRYPRVQFIFCHAGGTLFYSTFRFLRHYRNAKPEIKALMPDGLVPALNKFHYDTALTANIHAMASFRTVVSTTQLIFGTDYPFGDPAADALGLRDCGFTETELQAIEYENARRLLPRLKNL